MADSASQTRRAISPTAWSEGSSGFAVGSARSGRPADHSSASDLGGGERADTAHGEADAVDGGAQLVRIDEAADRGLGVGRARPPVGAEAGESVGEQRRAVGGTQHRAAGLHQLDEIRKERRAQRRRDDDDVERVVLGRERGERGDLDAGDALEHEAEALGVRAVTVGDDEADALGVDLAGEAAQERGVGCPDDEDAQSRRLVLGEQRSEGFGKRVEQRRGERRIGEELRHQRVGGGQRVRHPVLDGVGEERRQRRKERGLGDAVRMLGRKEADDVGHGEACAGDLPAAVLFLGLLGSFEGEEKARHQRHGGAVEPAFFAQVVEARGLGEEVAERFLGGGLDAGLEEERGLGRLGAVLGEEVRGECRHGGRGLGGAADALQVRRGDDRLGAGVAVERHGLEAHGLDDGDDAAGRVAQREVGLDDAFGRHPHRKVGLDRGRGVGRQHQLADADRQNCRVAALDLAGEEGEQGVEAAVEQRRVEREAVLGRRRVRRRRGGRGRGCRRSARPSWRGGRPGRRAARTRASSRRACAAGTVAASAGIANGSGFCGAAGALPTVALTWGMNGSSDRRTRLSITKVCGAISRVRTSRSAVSSSTSGA